MVRVFALLCFLCVLFSCSSKKDDDITKKEKLVDFESSVSAKRLWTVSTGEGKGRKYLRLVPAIDNQTIYAADANGNVSAFDLESGKRLWRTGTDYRVTGGVGAGGGKVFFGTDDGELIVLNATDGELLWKAQTSSEILSAPATNGEVIVAQTIDARVFAYSIDSGDVLWSYDHLSPVLSLRGTASPVFVSNQVICAFDNGQIVSFAVSDGSRTWEARVGQPKGKTDLERIVDVDGTPVIQSGILYAASYQGSLMTFGRAKGNAIWKKPVSTHSRVAVAGGKVFVTTERSEVIAYNSANGDIIWQNDQLKNRGLEAPSISGEYVLTVDEDDHLHILSQSDGSFAHRFKPAGDGFHAPMLSMQDNFYVLSDNGKLSAYQIVAK